jgi:hypothetical protein
MKLSMELSYEIKTKIDEFLSDKVNFELKELLKLDAKYGLVKNYIQSLGYNHSFYYSDRPDILSTLDTNSILKEFNIEYPEFNDDITDKDLWFKYRMFTDNYKIRTISSCFSKQYEGEGYNINVHRSE